MRSVSLSKRLRFQNWCAQSLLFEILYCFAFPTEPLLVHIHLVRRVIIDTSRCRPWEAQILHPARDVRTMLQKNTSLPSLPKNDSKRTLILQPHRLPVPLLPTSSSEHHSNAHFFFIEFFIVIFSRKIEPCTRENRLQEFLTKHSFALVSWELRCKGSALGGNEI